MKLRSAFIGLLLLVVLAMLAACDTNQTPTPVATSVSGNNPTTGAVDTQPTSVPQTGDTPVSNPPASITQHVTGNTTRLPKTTPAFTFMPRRGGPGAIINITGGNFTPGKTVVIRVGIPQPIGEPLTSVQVGDNGMWNTSIKIPATEPSGQPITTTDMQIVVMDENNQVIASEPFAFTPK